MKKGNINLGHSSTSSRNLKLTESFSRAGFTTLELLIVIAIIGILSGAVIVTINPIEQFTKTRNNQRLSNVTSVLDAVDQNIIDNRGIFICSEGDVPTSTVRIAATSTVATTTYNLAPCIVPTYIVKMPHDPSDEAAYYSSTTDYDTGYYIVINASTSRVTVSAPSAELGKTIEVTR